MKTSTRSFSPGRRTALSALLAASASAALVACGGGGGGDAGGTETAPPTSASAPSYTLGAITGFGSVVVGGVRYDDSTATVTDDDGVAWRNSDLKLGMVVELEGSRIDRVLGTAIAQRIRFGSEIVGPVGSIDIAASTAIVLGQTVLVTTSTVFDSSLAGGLSALSTGAVIEVHGIFDPLSGRTTATRIEPKPSPAFYRLRGVVAELDTTAKTFKLGGELISYASAANVPATLANGRLLRVLLRTAKVNGAWVATRVGPGIRGPGEGVTEAHIEGVVTSFTSSAAFAINGLQVDASGASFPDGTAAIVLGARVEAEGNIVNGVLVATKVEIEDRHEGGQRPLELHGLIASVDTTTQTFALRGVTVWYGGTVVWRNGSAADLAANKRVEVHGVLSADRTRLEARRIEFKN